MKINKKYIFIIVFILLSGIITTTYSYFQGNIIKDKINPLGVTTGNLDITLSDSSVNVNNMEPIYDNDYNILAYNKEFTIENTSTLNSCTKIYLNISNISESLKSNYFKYRIESETNFKEGNFKEINEDNTILLLDNEFIEISKIKRYTLYIWLSYSEIENQIDMLNTSLKANIMINNTDSLNTYCE